MNKVERPCTEQCESLSAAELLHIIGGVAPPAPPPPLVTDSTGGASERGSESLASSAPGLLGD